MRTLTRVVFLAAICVLPCCAATVIKLGSLAPTGSPWDDALKQIANEWSRISGGKITMKIYAGGVAGDELDMTRKMRLGQLNAAGVTGVALVRIFPPILNMQVPMLIRTNDEVEYVLDKMKPRFEKGLEDKGFKIIAWNIVGWAHFFSKTPVVNPADMQKLKMFVYGGDADAVQTWELMGFRPVPLTIPDLMPSLQSGMVEAFTTTPLSAASYQWFGLAKNMCGMQWAPLLGGIIVSMTTWNSLPADLRPALQAATDRIAGRMQDTILTADLKAIDVMGQNGLKVSTVPPEAVAKWQAIVDKGVIALNGKTLDVAIIEEIRGILAEYRSRGKAGK